MAKKSYRVKGVSYKFKYTHAQRAAYWKKKYLDLIRRMKDW